MRIDAHQHFWIYSQQRHAWIDESMAGLRRDFLPKDLQPELKEAKIQGTVAVQAEESQQETDFLLDLAQKHPWIKAVVGWLDLCDPRLEEKLEAYRSQIKLKGFREILQAKDPQYMLQKEFISGLELLGSRGYCYDILVYPSHLQAVSRLLESCKEQPFVIDHLAKPYIKENAWKTWKKEMAVLAERDYIYAKVSGLITEADWKTWKPEELYPYLEIALELFGPKRLMYGSDWPVCTLAGTHQEVFGLIDSFTNTLSTDEKSQILGKNAANFYQINES